MNEPTPQTGPPEQDKDQDTGEELRPDRDPVETDDDIDPDENEEVV